MLVPRSFKYGTPSVDRLDEKRNVRTTPSSGTHRSPLTPKSPPLLSQPARTVTEPVTIPSAKTARASPPQHVMSTRRGATVDGRRRKTSAHDPDALSPSVAALLAVTAIPPRRPNRYRVRSEANRRISIEELVSEWKSDDSLKSSYGTSPVLSKLLEETDDNDESSTSSRKSSTTENGFLKSRSESSDSVPSLEADDMSILSLNSLSTPDSLHSRRSISNLKRDRARPIQVIEDCIEDHPLVSLSDSEDEGIEFPIQKRTPQPTKSKSSFKSNLTASLQTLKNAAINSITSFGRNGASLSTPTYRPTAPPIDDMLWSHPFLFPRFSSEIRPSTDQNPSNAERRYLNPIPLTFEEQEAPFQQALHAPYLAAADEEAAHSPKIPMQTYSRSARRKSSRRGHHHGPDPNSEAGRALLGASAIRHREIRENSDFLRVVVLEMNMRRQGKLESGRAKIWLPPREQTKISVQTLPSSNHVPRRWAGVSAY